jgi:hypothetical protein
MSPTNSPRTSDKPRSASGADGNDGDAG